MKHPKTLALLFLLGLFSGACTAVRPAETPPIALPTASPTPQTQARPVAKSPTVAASVPASGATYQRLDGNRIVAGAGDLPDVAPLELPLAGTPTWLAAAPLENGSIWVVTLADGQVQAFQLSEGSATPISVEPTRLPAGTPPLLVLEDGAPRLVTAPDDASPLTHPVPLAGQGRIAYITRTGDVAIWSEEEGESARFPVNALPDARILVDERARLLVLTDATDRYNHNILGDGIEAGSVTLIETSPAPRIGGTIPISAPRVIEGIAPLWADLTDDGVREIILTVSDSSQGAQELVFAETGAQIAAGPAIGQGNRWRHQLAVAPFAPDGTMTLVEVLTPHIGGNVQFSRLDGPTLGVVAGTTGYTSHRIGSRNVDMAIAGDFDGDGMIELLLPDEAYRSLGAVRLMEAGAEVVWTLPMGDARVATNLAAVTLENGQIAVGVGREDGVLRIWTP